MEDLHLKFVNSKKYTRVHSYTEFKITGSVKGFETKEPTGFKKICFEYGVRKQPYYVEDFDYVKTVMPLRERLKVAFQIIFKIYK